MNLREFEVKNFKALGSQGAKLLIDRIVVILGENNIGKSSLLDAYELFCSGSPKINPEHVHSSMKEGEQVELIALCSDVTDEDIESIGQDWVFDTESYNKCIRVKYTFDAMNTAGEKHSWHPAEETWKKGGTGGWKTKLASRLPLPIRISPFTAPDEYESRIAVIIGEAAKEAKRNDNERYNDIVDRFNALTLEFAKEVEDEIDSFRQLINESFTSVFPGYGTEIEPRADKFEPEKAIATGSRLRIINPQGLSVPLAEQGTGIQKAILWSSIKALGELGRFTKTGRNDDEADRPKVLMLEEPESFLHPPMIRSCRNALYSLAEADNNWQVMITTHSPIFVDVSKPHTSIVRVGVDGEGESKYFLTESAEFDESEKKKLAMIRACHPTINEFFFAKIVILVEGETEELALSYLLTEEDHSNGYYVLNCGSKTNIPMFQKILNQFNMPYIVIHDLDSPKSDRKNKDGINYRNSAWSINETIFGLASVDGVLRPECELIACVPDFEREYYPFAGKINKDKPSIAYDVISSVGFDENEETANLRRLVQDIKDKTHPKSYNSLEKQRQLVEEWLEANPQENMEIWQFD